MPLYRYATLPHTCLCSDVARTEQPWAEKITFGPSGNERQVIVILLVFYTAGFVWIAKPK